MMTVQDSFIALPVFSFLQLEFECAPANVGQVTAGTDGLFSSSVWLSD